MMEKLNFDGFEKNLFKFVKKIFKLQIRAQRLTIPIKPFLIFTTTLYPLDHGSGSIPLGSHFLKLIQNLFTRVILLC